MTAEQPPWEFQEPASGPIDGPGPPPEHIRRELDKRSAYWCQAALDLSRKEIGRSGEDWVREQVYLSRGMLADSVMAGGDLDRMQEAITEDLIRLVRRFNEGQMKKPLLKNHPNPTALQYYYSEEAARQAMQSEREHIEWILRGSPRMKDTVPCPKTEDNMTRVPEVAFRRGLHRLRSRSLVRYMQDWVRSMPTVTWDALREGKTYAIEERRWRTITVVRTTPKRAQALALVDDRQDATRLYRPSYKHCTFYQLDDELVSMLGVLPDDIVREAVRRGLDIPVPVRCEHPELFVTGADRLTQGGRHPGQGYWMEGEWRWGCPEGGPHEETTIDRLRSALNDSLVGEPCTRKKVLEWIDAAQQRIEQLSCAYLRAEVESDDFRKEFDRVIGTFLRDIDFFAWMLPLVSEGGPFYQATPEDESSDGTAEAVNAEQEKACA